MIEDLCDRLLPNIGVEGEEAVLLGQCWLRRGHSEEDHLVFLYNPFRSSFIMWSPDREGDDGSEDYQDYLYTEIPLRKALKLMYKHWGPLTFEMINLLKKSATML